MKKGLFFTIVGIGFTGFIPTDHSAVLAKIQRAYSEAKTLSFDGHIQYYTDAAATSPAEIMDIKYRRAGEKLRIEIGNQITVYDGTVNIIADEDKHSIFISAKKAATGKSVSPTGQLEEFLKSGQFDFKEEDYVGGQKKIIIRSPKVSQSAMEFLYDPKTYFINFARMTVEGNEMLTDERINHKKFEYSYYHYQLKLDAPISVAPFIVKKGKQFAGVGKYSGYEIIIL